MQKELKPVNKVKIKLLDVDGTVLKEDEITNTVTQGWSNTCAYLALNGARPTGGTTAPDSIVICASTQTIDATSSAQYHTTLNSATGLTGSYYYGNTTNSLSGGTITAQATITATAAFTVAEILLGVGMNSQGENIPIAYSTYNATLNANQQIQITWQLNF
jgi:hypothetical protein